jgi:hypothetical protein
MKVFFYLLNSPDRACSAFLDAANIRDGDGIVHCNYGGDLISGGFANSALASEISSSRATAPGEVIVVLIHPRSDFVQEIMDWMHSRNDPLSVLALCSADPAKLRDRIPNQMPPGTLVLSEPLPDGVSSEFGCFHQAVRDLIQCVRRIETNADCFAKQLAVAGIVDLYVKERREAARRRRFEYALTVAVNSGSEGRARSRVCFECYDSEESFLKDARHFDRIDGLTWVGQVSSFHHSTLSPKFRSAAQVFVDPSRARAEWIEHQDRLCALLNRGFPFGLLEFARAAKGEAVAPRPFEAVDQILAFVGDMTAGLRRTDAEVFTVLGLGMSGLSDMLTALRTNWYLLA